MLDIPRDTLEEMTLQSKENASEDFQQGDWDKVVACTNTHMVGTHTSFYPPREAMCYLSA